MTTREMAEATLADVETQALIVHLRHRIETGSAEREVGVAADATAPLDESEERALAALALHAAALVSRGQGVPYRGAGQAGMSWNEDAGRWNLGPGHEAGLTPEGRLVRRRSRGAVRTVLLPAAAAVTGQMAILAGASTPLSALEGVPRIMLALTSFGVALGAGAVVFLAQWWVECEVVRRWGVARARRWFPGDAPWDTSDEPALARAVAAQLAEVVDRRGREIVDEARRAGMRGPAGAAAVLRALPEVLDEVARATDPQAREG